MKNVKKDKLFIFTGFVRAVDPYCKLIFFEFSLLNNAWYNKFLYGWNV